MKFPVLVVEVDALFRCESQAELDALYSPEQLFVLDTEHHYFTPTGEQIARQWDTLQRALINYLANEGQCCLSKIHFNDEQQVWALITD